MGIEGKWWIFYGDESLDSERTRFYELVDGMVRDGRTGDDLGRYEAVDHIVRLSFAKRRGRALTIDLLTAVKGEPANLEVESCMVDFKAGADSNYGSAVRHGPEILAINARNKGLRAVH